MIEMIVATGIAGVLVMIVSQLMASNFRSSMKFEQGNEGWLDTIAGSSDFTRMVNGIARIDPPEDLLTDGDALYSGVTNLQAFVPSICDPNPAFSVARMTSFAVNQRSERSLRLWSSSSVNKRTAADELRLTYDSGSAFASSAPPKELYLIDADGNWRRRFPIVSFVVRNTSLDPNDDLPKRDASGAAITFHYVAVFLADPKKPDGGSMAPLTLDFLSNSVAIPTRTWDICLSKDGHVVRLAEGPNEVPQMLIHLKDQNMQPQTFKIEFANSRNDTRTDALTYYTDLANEPTRACASLLRFTIELANIYDVSAAGTRSSTIHMRRSVLIENYLPARPMACP
jgi:hypothetical protein